MTAPDGPDIFFLTRSQLPRSQLTAIREALQCAL